MFDERFLLSRPVLRAPRAPVVLLVDEIDRADDEFGRSSSRCFRRTRSPFPRWGPSARPSRRSSSSRQPDSRAARRPQAPLPLPLDRPPGLERELAIVRSRAPHVAPALAEQVVRLTQRLRHRDDLLKPPGVAETLDWARALEALGAADLDIEVAAATLGVAVKYREDADRVRASLDQMLRA